MKPTKKRKIPARECIARAYWDDSIEALKRLNRAYDEEKDLREMDPVVARRALKVFEDPKKAALWLVTLLKQLGGGAAIACIRADALLVLGQLEHGVFS
jgi:hypothetical protein